MLGDLATKTDCTSRIIALLLMVGGLVPTGCGGSGSGSGPGGDANPDAAAQDTRGTDQGADDLPQGDAGPTQDSSGADTSDAGVFFCPHGENPEGNGCFLPCMDGWHLDSDGGCRLDCPPFLADDGTGACTSPICSAGSEELNMHFEFPSETGEIETETARTCLLGCPAGMVAEGHNLSMHCTLPCGDGWSEGPDERCILDCPEGMTTVDGKCEFLQVGESKVCPDGLYDDSVEGPNPLYVNVNDDTPTPDGTQEHPYHSIMDAVAAGGDTMTIHVAQGEYTEQVLLEGLTEVRIVGACAVQVTIVGTDLVGGAGTIVPGAIHAWNVGTLSIEGVSVESELTGILAFHETAGLEVSIRDVHVRNTGYTGIDISHTYKSISVKESTVENAMYGGIVVYALDVVTTPAEVTVSGNSVAGIVPCEGLEQCGLNTPTVGISVAHVTKLVVLDNHLSGFEHVAGGIVSGFSDSVTIRRNLLRDLSGYAAIYLFSPDEGTFDLTENRIRDSVAGSVDGKDMDAFIGIGFDTSEGVATGMVARNLVQDVQGFGLITHGVSSLDISMEAVGNEFVSLPWAMLLSGDQELEGNRVFDCGVALMMVATEGSSGVRFNEFRQAADHDFGLPEGNLKSLLESQTYCIDISMPDAGSDLEFHGNRVLECTGGVALVSKPLINAVSVVENVFENNFGVDLSLAGMAYIDVQGNRFSGDSATGVYTSVQDSALFIEDWETEGPMDVTVVGNHFQLYQYGYALVIYNWGWGLKNNLVEGNVFIAAGDISINGLGREEYAEFQDNDILVTRLTSIQFGGLGFSMNRFFGLDSLLYRQASGRSSEIVGNLFTGARLRVGEADGIISVTDNEFLEPLGFGLVVTASPGDVTARHNLFLGVGSLEWPGAGFVADGIHVTGIPELGASSVEVYENRIEGNARLGVLVSGSSAVVEGNMYLDNGTACHGDCDLVAQNLPSEDALTGADAAFAVRPHTPYGVLTSDNLFE